MLTLTKKGKNFQLEGTIAGRRIRESTHTSDKQIANLKKAEVELAIINGTYEWKSTGKLTKTFSDVADEYMLSRRTGKTRSHYLKVEYLRQYFQHTPVTEITGAVVDRYINERCAHLTNNSVRSYLTVLTAILNYAHAAEYCKKPKISRPTEEESNASAIEDSALESIMGLIDSAYIPVLTFMKYTGCRPSEAFKLTYGQIDFDNKLVKLISIKGNGGARPRTLPIHENVFKLLPPKGNKKKGDLVFSDVNLTGLQYRWKVARKKANVIEGSYNNTLYSIRHRFGTKLGREGVPVVVIKDLMGHASLDMTMRYVSTQLTDHQLAIGKL